MIALCLHLGGACPPHWVFQGFVALGQVSDGNGGRGGRWAHAPALVSRRVVKLTIYHYYSAPLPLKKRSYVDEIRKPVVFMIQSTGSGLSFGRHGMHNGCDFWN